MSQENTITLRGFVTAEPRFWQPTPTHTPVAEIRIGSTPRRLNRATGEWEDGETSYYNIKCWRRLAVNVKGSLRKGDMVLIRGKVVMRTWVDDQQRTRVQMQVEADSVGHDLAYGWSHFNRGAQGGWPSSRAVADGEVARQNLDASADAEDDAGDPGDLDEATAQGDPLMAEATSPGAGMPGPLMAEPGIPASGIDGAEDATSELTDADFERLTAGPDAEAEIVQAY